MTVGYADVLGTSSHERERLTAQATALEPEASALLDTIGIGTGWRAVDVGCGPVGVLDLLSSRVGPSGTVTGIEAVPRFADMAEAVSRDRGLTNVRIVMADARASGLPASSFDLVHERLVLIGPDRIAVAAAMVELARPGGLVVAQEIDIATSFCEPSNPACERLLEAFLASTRLVGAEPSIGRQLGRLLAGAGVADVKTDARARLEPQGSARRMQLPSLVAHARDGMLRNGVLGDSELDGLVGESVAHHSDPATLVFGGLLFQAWGRKPAITAPGASGR